jgi:hypothetical protein
MKQLIDRPNFAHLATLMPDGSPQSVPVWIGREGDHGRQSAPGKARSKQEHAAAIRASRLSIVDFDNPYEEVQIRGRVIERRSDPELKVMDPISHKYTGQTIPLPRSGRTRGVLIIEVEKERYTKLPFERTPSK